MTRVLVIDNYDSFVFNLVQYLGQLGAAVVVRRNDDVDAAGFPALVHDAGVDGVLISRVRGPPENAGISIAAVQHCAGTALPMLGVCLGHQAMAVAFGGTVSRAPELLHGKTSEVHHGGDGVLAGLPDPFIATRYHSLAVEEPTLPPQIVVNGRTAHDRGGIVMSMRHRTLPLHGVQFHPESVLTQHGHRLLANWLDLCGDTAAASLAPALSDEVEALRLTAFS